MAARASNGQRPLVRDMARARGVPGVFPPQTLGRWDPSERAALSPTEPVNEGGAQFIPSEPGNRDITTHNEVKTKGNKI